MQIIFDLTVLFFVLTFAAKSTIHAVLDNRNGYKIDFESSRGYVYFLPYDKVFSETYKKLKKVCNTFPEVIYCFFGCSNCSFTAQIYS